MASVVAGGLFNAVAFAGAGFLFSKLNHSGYEAERKRHDKALEDLAKAKEKWYENRMEKKDKIDQLRRRLNEANVDINATNDALKELHRIEYKGHTYTAEPKLTHFYQPGDEMKTYMSLFIGGLGLVGGYIAHMLV